jgi:predicted porin
MLLYTNFCGQTQIVGGLQGQYYWEQNLYLEEQSIWLYQQF